MKNWTVLIFMVPDKRLEEAARQDLAEMEAAGVPDDLNLAVHIDFEKGPERYVFSGEKSNAVRRVAGPNGISASLENFLAFSQLPGFQAKQQALILWGHGQGIGTKLSVPAPFGSAAAQARRAPNPLRRMNPVQVSPKMQSSGSGYRVPPPSISSAVRQTKPAVPRALDITDVATVLSEHSKRTGRKIDLLGFDACFMAGIEVAFQLRNVAELLVASQDFVPDEGWDYQQLLELIALSRDGDARRVGEALVRQVTKVGGLTNLTLMDLTKCPTLAKLAGALNEHLVVYAEDKARIQLVFKNASYLRARQLIDLRSLCDGLVEDFGATEDPADAYVRVAAEATLQMLEPFVVKHQAEPAARMLRGVSVFYPHVRAGSKLEKDTSPAEMNVSIDPKEYADLDVVRASGWGQLLQNLDRRGPRQFDIAPRISA